MFVRYDTSNICLPVQNSTFLYHTGITETVIALVLWEQFKKAIYETYGPGPINSAVAAAGAKLIATTVAYPHGLFLNLIFLVHL